MKASGMTAPVRVSLMALLTVVAAGLGYVVLGLESASAGVVELVATNLGESGVSNPVTAVLLNFRGYDTFLEMTVLLLALVGVWSLGDMPRQQDLAARPFLYHVPQMLIPVLLLVAGYLLWAGAHSPGGAFQAGSVLGAAGVLLLLAGWHIDEKFSGMLARVVLLLGLSLFLLAGLFPLLSGGAFLQYPPPLAGMMILLIETAATVSIGATLAMLFVGGLPGR